VGHGGAVVFVFVLAVAAVYAVNVGSCCSVRIVRFACVRHGTEVRDLCVH